MVLRAKVLNRKVKKQSGWTPWHQNHVFFKVLQYSLQHFNVYGGLRSSSTRGYLCMLCDPNLFLWGWATVSTGRERMRGRRPSQDRVVTQYCKWSLNSRTVLQNLFQTTVGLMISLIIVFLKWSWESQLVH